MCIKIKYSLEISKFTVCAIYPSEHRVPVFNSKDYLNCGFSTLLRLKLYSQLQLIQVEILRI